MPKHTDQAGITTTQYKNAPVAEPCCHRQGPHVHYVPRKPPVNAAGDVDVYDASNQPSGNFETGEITPAIPVDMTEHTPVPIEEAPAPNPVCDTCGSSGDEPCRTAKGTIKGAYHAPRAAALETETEEAEDAEVV